jgi:hypothetical protein
VGDEADVLLDVALGLPEPEDWVRSAIGER